MLAKIFKAYDVRAVHPDPLDESAAWKVGYATGQHLLGQTEAAGQARLPGTVLVSRDMRPSSPALAGRLIAGLRSAGADVIDLGMCDTSFIYFAINHLGAAGGVQVTASHNPVQYNGFKISGREARPIGADTGLKDIQALAEAVTDARMQAAQPAGKLEERDLWADYRRHVLRFFQPPAGARTLKVFIDCCNGMGTRLVPTVFGGVPGLELITLNAEFRTPWAHEPNPLVAANMVPTQEGVRRHRADLGVCFDGDADRCMLTDEQGRIIGCDHLTALLATVFLRQSPGAAVVYDLRSSKAVEETVRKLGGRPVRSRVGHVFMKAMLRQSQGVFGGELSGHFYFRDSFCTDSGAITFAAVASLLAAGPRPLSVLVRPYQCYPQSGERNFHVEDKAGVLAALRQRYAGRAAIDELDGVTVDAWDRPGAAGGFWFNVRASNTEPLMRLNAEARDPSALDRLLAEVTPLLGQPAKEH